MTWKVEPSSIISLNGNLLAAVDVETSGRDPFYNEVVQIAIVPLDINIEPTGDPFYCNICPTFPERMHPDAVKTHGLTQEYLDQFADKYAIADYLWDWFQEIGLPPGKRIIPLLHNCQFDIPFIMGWLGLEMFYEVFGYPTRDTQALIAAMQDKAAYKGFKIPFNFANLAHVCEVLGIEIGEAHDALDDALATAKVYKALLTRGAW